MSQKALDIIYQDDQFVAINKPAGLLVHPSFIDKHEKETALHRLQDQIGRPVFVIHRLDKPTSGIVLFALSAEAAGRCATAFMGHEVKKTYLAVVRGYTAQRGTISKPLNDVPDKILDKKRKLDKEPKASTTDYRRLAMVEIPAAISRHAQSRYSLVEVHPKTGRMHQIRRHLKHIRHPIIGDTKHGDHKHNRYFREELDNPTMLLSSTEMIFLHPYSGEKIALVAPLGQAFQSILREFNWLDAVPEAWLA